MEGKISPQDEDFVRLDIPRLENGMYVLSLRPKNQKPLVVKFVIEKDY